MPCFLCSLASIISFVVAREGAQNTKSRRSVMMYAAEYDDDFNKKDKDITSYAAVRQSEVGWND